MPAQFYEVPRDLPPIHQSHTGKIARTHGHRMDSACCRRTPYLHHLHTASVHLCTALVHLRTISVRIRTASTMEIPWSKWSQYGLKRYANGASTASVYSRLSPSHGRAYGPFSLCKPQSWYSSLVHGLSGIPRFHMIFKFFYSTTGECLVCIIFSVQTK